MAGSLNPGFDNHINVVTIRAFGSRSDVYTDRAFDFDGSGVKEKVTITHVSGHAGGTGGGKVRTTVTTPTGAPRTLVAQSNEKDGGVDVTGVFYTLGVE